MSVTRHSVPSLSCSLTWGDILGWSRSNATSVTRSSYPLSHSSVMQLCILVWLIALLSVEGFCKKGKQDYLASLQLAVPRTMCELNETSVFPLQKALFCLFQGRSHLSALSVEGVLHGLLISKFTCQCTARINHTSVASVRRCSLALAHWRNTSEPTQVCNSFLMYPVVSPLILSLFFASSSSLPSISFLRTCSSNWGRET